MFEDEKRDYPDQYMMRFPKGMRDELKAAAKENGRALNTEIIARLEEVQELKEKLNDYSAVKTELDLTTQRLEDLLSDRLIQKRLLELFISLMLTHSETTLYLLNDLIEQYMETRTINVDAINDFIATFKDNVLLAKNLKTQLNQQNLSPENQSDTKEE